MTEKLFGRPLEPKMIFEGRDELEKIVDDYRSATREEKQFKSPSYCLIFVTDNKFYWRSICLDETTVYDNNSHVASESLKKYFDELGITKELLTK
jgi:hypothetical protein